MKPQTMAYFHIYTYLYDTFPLLIVNLQQQDILQLAAIVLVELIVSGSHCLLLSSDGDWFCIQYWPKSKDNSRNPMNFVDTHCCMQSSFPYAFTIEANSRSEKSFEACTGSSGIHGIHHIRNVFDAASSQQTIHYINVT